MDKVNGQKLELIGFLPKKGAESKVFLLLQAILKTKSEKVHLTFSEIYDAFIAEQDGTTVSKAWVHRLLKSLIDNKLVEVESKNRYICDVNTLTNGLSYLKKEKLNEIDERFVALASEKENIEAVNISQLANNLYESVTGLMKLPASRFLKGLDEFQRVTNETIYQVAKEGDIIRTSVTGKLRFGSKPFIDSFASRLQRVVTAASKRVDVRYTIPPIDLGSIDALWKGDTELQVIKGMLELISDDDEGPGFHFRFNQAGQKSHQFVSLNNEIVTMWISEYPATAAWITREFNADLIDDIINTFDEHWKQSSSVRKHLKEAMKKRGFN